ncbi:hypothetical protein [Aquimarina sp. I32.4]|uniref:hypothetical protein n=1 Tax=Aquimarina sp. I32.4 TaxID=2053903 RepID=UPI000CDE9C23|nr:hypothetical protein [Aquimarina sp. I32.4]
MKKIINVILIVFSLIGCAQSKQREIKPNTTSSGHKIIKHMNKLNRFDYEPIYNLKVRTIYSYEILINDIPIVSRHNNATGTIWYPINNSLLSIENHNLSIRIFPRYTSDKIKMKTLESDVNFSLALERSSWLNGSMKEPEIVFQYELPKYDNNEQEINYSKLIFFEDKLSFKAKVPYDLTDWRNSLNLTKKSKEKLEEKVLFFYKNLKEKYENQKGDEYLTIIDKGIFNLFQANYFSEEEGKNKIKSKINFINKKKRKLAPVDNYELKFFGEGKLVALKRTDGNNQGEGVLRRYYTKNGVRKVQIEEILLHIPEGKEELEVIWYYNIVRVADQ